MTRDVFIEYWKAESKEVTPVMFYYYKLRGGTYPEGYFTVAFQRWIVVMGGGNVGLVIAKVFSDLTKHFKVD